MPRKPSEVCVFTFVKLTILNQTNKKIETDNNSILYIIISFLYVKI